VAVGRAVSVRARHGVTGASHDRRRDAATLHPSRTAVVRLLVVGAIGIYVAATVALLVLVERLGGAAT
jgi:hypothetical protein